MNLRETINQRRFMKPVSIACLALALALLAGCGENKTTAPNPNVAHKHEHKPPHGGAPVVLGDEEYHVELVLDAPAGKLDAYVFDVNWKISPARPHQFNVIFFIAQNHRGAAMRPVCAHVYAPHLGLGQWFCFHRSRQAAPTPTPGRQSKLAS